jgi:DNA mismatch endonuclease (patch repair protein)
MATVRSKDTSPELFVRRLVFRLGYRYRLHRRELPGNPDLVFNRLHRVIFVHGCFWHAHSCRHGQRLPQTNCEYWNLKLARNAERDRENLSRLSNLGWRSLVIWECELSDEPAIVRRLREFLGGKDQR